MQKKLFCLLYWSEALTKIFYKKLYSWVSLILGYIKNFLQGKGFIHFRSDLVYEHFWSNLSWQWIFMYDIEKKRILLSPPHLTTPFNLTIVCHYFVKCGLERERGRFLLKMSMRKNTPELHLRYQQYRERERRERCRQLMTSSTYVIRNFFTSDTHWEVKTLVLFNSFLVIYITLFKLMIMELIFRWQLRNRCASKEQSLLFNLVEATD